MSLLDEVAKLGKDPHERIGQADSLDSLRELKVRCLGRKGPLALILKGLKDLSEEERRLVGARANKLRTELEQEFATAMTRFAAPDEKPVFDPTLPGTGQR